MRVAGAGRPLTHTPADDPGERYLEGAACHGCLFIAECSCERFNRYLDRAAMEAVRRWKFKPAVRGGQAVAAEVIVPLEFNPGR